MSVTPEKHHLFQPHLLNSCNFGYYHHMELDLPPSILRTSGCGTSQLLSTVQVAISLRGAAKGGGCPDRADRLLGSGMGRIGLLGNKFNESKLSGGSATRDGFRTASNLSGNYSELRVDTHIPTPRESLRTVIGQETWMKKNIDHGRCGHTCWSVG